jgi:hypothetical protein
MIKEGVESGHPLFVGFWDKGIKQWVSRIFVNIRDDGCPEYCSIAVLQKQWNGQWEWVSRIFQNIRVFVDGRIVELPRYTQPDKDHQLLLHQLKLTLPAQPNPKVTQEGKVSCVDR